MLTPQERAKEVLRYYYNAAIGFPSFQFTFDEFIEQLQAIQPAFLDYYGQTLNQVTKPNGSLSESALKTNMEAFARAQGGAMPKTFRDLNDLYDPVKDVFDTSNISVWTRVASEGVTEAAVEIKDAAVIGGTGLLVGAVVFLAVYVTWVVRR